MLGKYDRVVLIDTENVHNECMEHLSELTENDLLILMQSENSFKILLEDIDIIRSWKCKIKVIKIKNGIQNAMDFCLVSEMAYRFAIMPNAKFYVISNDHGYRPVISVWRARGIDVKLFGSTECLKYDEISNCILQGELLNQVLKEHRKQLENKVTIKDIVTKAVADSEYTEACEDNAYESTDINLEELKYATNECEYSIKDNVKESTDNETESIEENIEQNNNSNNTDEKEIDNIKREQIEQCINDINEIKKSRREKKESELKDVPLDELEDSLMPDRDFNAKKLKQLVGDFSKARESKLVTIILNNSNFIDAEFQLRDVIKKNADKHIGAIEENWNIFRHSSD